LTCRKKRHLIIERRYIDIHHIFIREKVDLYVAVEKGGERRERGFRQGSHIVRKVKTKNIWVFSIRRRARSKNQFCLSLVDNNLLLTQVRLESPLPSGVH